MSPHRYKLYVLSCSSEFNLVVEVVEVVRSSLNPDQSLPVNSSRARNLRNIHTFLSFELNRSIHRWTARMTGWLIGYFLHNAFRKFTIATDTIRNLSPG